MSKRAAALLLATVLLVWVPAVQASGDLRRELTAEDGNERRRAVQQLGEAGDPSAVAALVAAYRAESGDAFGVKAACASALGRIRTAEAAAALSQMLGDADYWVRKKAVEALGEIPVPEAVSAVTGALADKDPRVRSAALLALGALKGPAEEFLPWLGEEDSRVASAALEGLTRTGAPQAGAALAAAMESPDPTIRYRAASLGARRGDRRGLEMLREAMRSSATAPLAWREAALAGCAAVPILAECVTDPACPQGEPALGALERQLECPEATEALTVLVDRPAAPPLQRVRAASALFDRREKLTGDQVGRIARLLSEADPDLMAVALQILLERGGPPDLEEVATLTRHGNTVVRHFALANLARFGGPGHEGPLVAALADANGANVRMALEGLARLGTRAAAAAVRPLLEDRALRRYAQAALDAIESRP